MNPLRVGFGTVGLVIAVSASCPAPPCADGQQAPVEAGKKPNIVFIMADDVGWFNIGAYHQGTMASPTRTSTASLPMA